jgi:hypothetical protein
MTNYYIDPRGWLWKYDDDDVLIPAHSQYLFDPKIGVHEEYAVTIDGRVCDLITNELLDMDYEVNGMLVLGYMMYVTTTTRQLIAVQLIDISKNVEYVSRREHYLSIDRAYILKEGIDLIVGKYPDEHYEYYNEDYNYITVISGSSWLVLRMSAPRYSTCRIIDTWHDMPTIDRVRLHVNNYIFTKEGIYSSYNNSFIRFEGIVDAIVDDAIADDALIIILTSEGKLASLWGDKFNEEGIKYCDNSIFDDLNEIVRWKGLVKMSENVIFDELGVCYKFLDNWMIKRIPMDRNLVLPPMNRKNAKKLVR